MGKSNEKITFYIPINKILEIIERLNHNGSISVKLLRKEIETLLGGEQK